MNAAARGRHLIADLYGVPFEALCDAERLEALLRSAARSAGAQVLAANFHGFGERAGVTGVLLLAESHISIHTWPECDYAAVDIFMCGGARPELALQTIEQGLQVTRCERREIARGASLQPGVAPV